MDKHIMLISAVVARLASGDMEFYRQLQQQVTGGDNTWDSLAFACRSVQVNFSQQAFPIEPNPTSDGVKLVSVGEVQDFANFSGSHSSGSLVGPGSALSFIARHHNLPKRVVISGCILRRDGYTYVAVYDKTTHALVLDDINDLEPTDAMLVR